MDVLTYLFDTKSVPDDALILADAADDTKRLSKGDMRILTRRLVAGWRVLLAKRQQDRFTVTCHAFNNIDYPLLFYGVVGAGGVFSGSNPSYTVAELTHHLRTSDSTFIITEAEHLEKMEAAAASCLIPRENIFVLDSPSAPAPRGYSSWRCLLESGEQDWISFNDDQRAAETPVALLSTSGTTGLPKMAIRTHKNLVAECEALSESQAKPYPVRRALGIPIFHAFAYPLCYTTSLRYGIPTFIMRRFQYDLFLDVVSKFDITETALVPPIIKKHLLEATSEEKEKLAPLRTIFCGGAPLDAAAQREATKSLHPAARITQVYGMTEAGWVSMMPWPQADVSGSVGRLVGDYEAQTLGPEGQTLAEGQYGELAVRGSMVLYGYLGNEEAMSSTVDANGWLRTGDMAYLQEGRVYLVDRIKDLIKVRGWQVSPTELEAVLLKHEAIQDAAVIGVTPTGSLTEIPRAYVVRRAGHTASKEQIKAHMLQHLARYKAGDCEFIFREALPKSATGKTLKKLLKAEAALETGGSINRDDSQVLSTDSLQKRSVTISETLVSTPETMAGDEPRRVRDKRRARVHQSWLAWSKLLFASRKARLSV